MFSPDKPQRIGFCLIDGYALMSTSAAIEPLRAANLLAGRALYDLRFVSLSGTQSRSSAGASFDCVPLAEAGLDFDLVFVVAGGDPLDLREPALSGWLRRLDRAGVRLGGISGGAALLAEAGLLESRRFTIHWQHFEALRARSPDYLMERRLFVIDRDRYTCAGGVAPLDMMHSIIAAEHGADFARRISDWFIHTRVRLADDPQKAGVAETYGLSHPALVAAVDLMTDHIADPLTLDQLAQLAGVGARQIQRLFAAQTGQPMMRFYRNLRLEKAAELLRRSALPVSEIALATGFVNVAHFTRAFREHYGTAPAGWRRAGRA
ncbi:GlxA family transcriptional regulator [Zavarzinia aquatilis]|uniref:AraC family transcriptional regulator n=1 Tax=Zavarzinia aquatilis TaxID=2211142 RepID=A0A317ECV8_9PROT|nr:GlxA family transcriptional regulator [Zavarzinia aquatilis]PWR24867.1 AraC family transcriptional regulator [Zavarzinia aquatilis]